MSASGMMTRPTVVPRAIAAPAGQPTSIVESCQAKAVNHLLDGRSDGGAEQLVDDEVQADEANTDHEAGLQALAKPSAQAATMIVMMIGIMTETPRPCRNVKNEIIASM